MKVKEKPQWTMDQKTPLMAGELIEILKDANPLSPVFIYDSTTSSLIPFYEEDIDLTVSDRVDINIQTKR